MSQFIVLSLFFVLKIELHIRNCSKLYTMVFYCNVGKPEQLFTYKNDNDISDMIANNRYE